jgi:hypothetical protein
MADSTRVLLAKPIRDAKAAGGLKPGHGVEHVSGPNFAWLHDMVAKGGAAVKGLESHARAIGQKVSKNPHVTAARVAGHILKHAAELAGVRKPTAKAYALAGMTHLLPARHRKEAVRWGQAHFFRDDLFLTLAATGTPAFVAFDLAFDDAAAV